VRFLMMRHIHTCAPALWTREPRRTPSHGAAAGVGESHGAPETEKLAAAPGAASAGAPPGRGREAVWNARSAKPRSPPSSESSRKRRSSFHAVASSSARWPMAQRGLRQV